MSGSELSISDLVAKPFGWGSALRRRRFFHPSGVLAHGFVERVAPEGNGLPIFTTKVVARVSKAIGTPGALPDAVGFALRLPPQDAGQTPWDVLLVTAGSNPVARAVALHPVTSWTGHSMTNLMPVQYEGSYWWLRARFATQVGGAGLSLDSLRNHLQQGEIEVTVDQACGRGDFTPLARITLTEAVVDHDVSFDPVRNTAPGLTLFPGWLADLRASAYARSRDGRDA